MALEMPGRPRQWRDSAWVDAARRIAHLDRLESGLKTRVALILLPALTGAVLGILVAYMPPVYLLLTLGGLVFAALLLFKIEIAILVAILIRTWLVQFNYLGSETPMHPNGMMGVAIIGGAVAFFVLNRVDFSRLRAFWPFLAFAVIYLVSLVRTGEYLMDSVTVALRLITALAIYAVLVYKLDSIKKINWLILAVIAAQILPTVQGLIRVAQGGGMDLEAAEIVRSGHSGQGAFLAMTLAFCLVQFLEAGTRRRVVLWGGLVGLFGVGLFFSYGRAGWIGFGITAVLIGLMKRSKLLIVFPVILVLLIALVPTVSQRFSDIDLAHLEDRNYSSYTLAGRLEMWQISIQAWTTSPLIGVGYGAGRHQLEEHGGRMASMLHNDYLAVLVGTGLIGLTVFLLWHGQWFVELLRVRRTARDAYDRTLILSVFAMFFASLVVSITDNVLESTEKLYPLVALVAAALALPRIRAEEAASPAAPDPSKGRPAGSYAGMARQRERAFSRTPGEDFQRPGSPPRVPGAAMRNVDQEV